MRGRATHPTQIPRKVYCPKSAHASPKPAANSTVGCVAKATHAFDIIRVQRPFAALRKKKPRAWQSHTPYTNPP
ncbi:hypothetical protein [Kingella potus]|uniref:hypothetical protein n=1 Tax=Kingella potus TaxID=265175 RepID=UPI001FD2DC7A|nr:hypothetical protein [Kingella potus]UOP01804.1 hypothetical protein LVJ84_06830 [Kingella potus]